MDISNIINALRGRQAPSGTIVGAGQQLDGRAYQLHVAEAQANGQPPLSPEEFSRQQTRVPQISQVPPGGLVPR